LVRTHGEVLLRARAGMPADEMPAAILEQLEGAHLLLRRGMEVTTAFPIIGPEPTAKLAAMARHITAGLVPILRPDLLAIREALRRSGFPTHAPAVILGHVLDGLSWRIVRRKIPLPDTSLSQKRPDWNGLFWARYPMAAGNYGTNDLRVGNATLVMVWNSRTAAALREIANDPSSVEAVGASQPSAAAVSLAGHQVPILDAVDGLRSACQSAAETVASAMSSQSDLLATLSNYGVQLSPAELVVIFGHELIWALGESMKGEGLVAATATDLGAAMFVHHEREFELG